MPGNMDEDIGALHEGPKFLANHLLARKKIRAQFKPDAKRLLDAHLIVTSVVASLVNGKSAVPGKTSKSLEGRLLLSATFVQGIEICETSIAEGLYVQAGALLRQELETLAAIREIQAGMRINSKTPNVKHLPLKLAALYGELSAAAHVADESMLDELIGEQINSSTAGASVVPRYHSHAALKLYSIHIVLVLLLALEIIGVLNELYDEKASTLHTRMLSGAIDILREGGWLLDKAPPSP